jgi:hypothetical protein
VRLVPTPVTAVLAGIFSGIAWPLAWRHFSGTDASATFGLMLATILLVALPAHAGVLGFARTPAAAGARVDTALLVRIGARVAAAAITAIAMSVLHAAP